MQVVEKTVAVHSLAFAATLGFVGGPQVMGGRLQMLLLTVFAVGVYLSMLGVGRRVMGAPALDFLDVIGVSDGAFLHGAIKIARQSMVHGGSTFDPESRRLLLYRRLAVAGEEVFAVRHRRQRGRQARRL